MEQQLRKRIRLQEYDYSAAGAYFVTICTDNKACILWQKPVGAHSVRLEQALPLSREGQIVAQSIEAIPQYYPSITVEKYVVMPNHVHLLLLFDNGNPGGERRTLCAPTLGRVIKQLKETATKRIGRPVWQKSYYDHIIRNEQDFLRIWQYVDNNPARWLEDKYYAED